MTSILEECGSSGEGQGRYGTGTSSFSSSNLFRTTFKRGSSVVDSLTQDPDGTVYVLVGASSMRQTPQKRYVKRVETTCRARGTEIS